MTSRSSPWMPSRFFTSTGSAASSAKCRSSAGSSRRALSSRSSINACCSALKVTMPSDRSSGTRRMASASATTALASRSCGARTAPGIDPVRHVTERHRIVPRDGGGEGDQASAIINLVRERDEALVPAAVVPGQFNVRDAGAEALVEDRVQVVRLQPRPPRRPPPRYAARRSWSAAVAADHPQRSPGARVRPPRSRPRS